MTIWWLNKKEPPKHFSTTELHHKKKLTIIFFPRIDNMNTTLQKKLETALKPSHLSIEDFSDGCGLKFRLVIVSDSFENKTTLASHRLVYDVLKEEMQAIHALEIKTYTPEKWNATDESEKRNMIY
ncbi:BolA-like family protein [Acanthocheilonema viteae]